MTLKFHINVELPKLYVEGSIPFARSNHSRTAPLK
jgi:hypothetical protein